MTYAPEIPGNFEAAVLSAVQKIIAKRGAVYDAKVKEVSDTGTTAGMVKVWAQELFPNSRETDPGAWRNAYPHQLYGHLTPDVGDVVKVRYKNFLDDDLVYEAHGYESSRAQTGTGQKVLFEYSQGGKVYSLYYDKTLPGFVIRTGDQTFKMKASGSGTWTANLDDGDQKVILDVSNHKITLQQGGSKIEIATSSIILTGDTTITGNLVVSGSLTCGGINSSGSAAIAGGITGGLSITGALLVNGSDYDLHIHPVAAAPGNTGVHT